MWIQHSLNCCYFRCQVSQNCSILFSEFQSWGLLRLHCYLDQRWGDQSSCALGEFPCCFTALSSVLLSESSWLWGHGNPENQPLRLLPLELLRPSKFEGFDPEGCINSLSWVWWIWELLTGYEPKVLWLPKLRVHRLSANQDAGARHVLKTIASQGEMSLIQWSLSSEYGIVCSQFRALLGYSLKWESWRHSKARL